MNDSPLKLNDEQKRAIHNVLGQNNINQILTNHLLATFYGPSSMLKQKIEKAKGTETSQFVSVLEAIQDASANVENWNKPQFERWALLAKLRLGVELDFDRLITLLDDATAKIPLKSHDVSWANAILPKLNEQNPKHQIPDVNQWRIGHWRLATFFHLFHNSNDPLVIEERTPLFFASTVIRSRSAVAMWLCARRTPGPAAVTPDWWQLGMVPLGPNQELSSGISYGFNEVLQDTPPSEQFHISWWLEEMAGGGGWITAIKQGSSCDSANVAAACLALALREKHAHHPLLDPKAGVSGRLRPIEKDGENFPPGTPLLEHPIFDIDGAQQKYDIANSAGIVTMLMSETNCNSVNAANQNTRRQSVKTLGDTYPALLATSADIQQAKQAMWCKPSFFRVNATERKVFERHTDAAIIEYFEQERSKRK